MASLAREGPWEAVGTTSADWTVPPGVVRRETADSAGEWWSPPWAAHIAQPVGRRPAGSGPRGGSSWADCRDVAPGTGRCQTPCVRRGLASRLPTDAVSPPARHPGNLVWPLNGLQPTGGLAEDSQALHFTRVQRPQAGPSDEEAGWARGLAGQTADPLPERTPSLGNSVEGGAAAWEVRAPALGDSNPARPKESPWLPPQSHPTPSSPSSAHQECARCRVSKNRS